MDLREVRQCPAPKPPEDVRTVLSDRNPRELFGFLKRQFLLNKVTKPFQFAAMHILNDGALLHVA
jgi:hypothetical protein